jgi:hypothetical protein
MFSGLQNGDVVGKPLDTVIQVVEEFRGSSSPSVYSGKVAGPEKACQVLLTPIADHYRNPQRRISHLLVNVEHLGGSNQGDTSSFEFVKFVEKTVATTSRKSPQRHHGFGTAG